MSLAGRMRLSDRQTCFLETAVLVLVVGAFIQATVFILNNSVLHMEVGRCCSSYEILHAFKPLNVLAFFAFAAAVGVMAAYLMV
jgi:hypothetical protein